MPEENNIQFNFSGISCDSIDHGWTTDCLDEYGSSRGFTQSWFFDQNRNAWISSTSTPNVIPDGSSGDLVAINSNGDLSGLTNLNLNQSQLKLEGSFCNKVKYHSPLNAASSITADISFNDSNIHFISFNGSGGTVNLNIVNAPDTGYFGEITLIVDDAGAPDTLSIVGNNGSSTVKMDGTITDSIIDDKLYMWKAWTIDSGSTYYVYRANGAGRYWN
jgi:hypothetical protein